MTATGYLRPPEPTVHGIIFGHHSCCAEITLAEPDYPARNASETDGRYSDGTAAAASLASRELRRCLRGPVAELGWSPEQPGGPLLVLSFRHNQN